MDDDLVRAKQLSLLTRNIPNGLESSMMPMSDQLHRPVLVAMIAMRMMELSFHQIIDMITVRDGFVSTVRTMLMA